MTIDKAIEWYKELECYTPLAKDARDVAIDTMKKYQQIERIFKTWNEVNDYSYNQATNEIGALINKDNYEPIEQEPKIWHWISHPKGIYAHLVCNRCLSSAPYDCKTNYCPNCGAKMVELS